MRHRQTLLKLVLAVFSFVLCNCGLVATKQDHLQTTYQDLLKSAGAISIAASPQADQQLEFLCNQGTPVACAMRGRAVAPSQPLAIMQGYTDDQMTWIAVLAPIKAKLTYLIFQKEHLQAVAPAVGVLRKFSNWRMDQVQVNGLKPGLIYELWVTDEEGQLLDRREFKALDVNKAKPRIVVASCLDDSFGQQQTAAWEKVRTRSPDLIFLIGDNVYTDFPKLEKGTNPEILWNRYVDTRMLLAVFRWAKLVPVLATWDDHDFGGNDSDRNYPFVSQSQQVFQAFFPRPQNTQYWSSGPGVSGAMTIFGQKFLFLDNRSFRTPNNYEQADQSHFGFAQNDWIFSELKRSKTLSWLISGDQFFGGYHKFESFEGSHPDEFPQFLVRLKQLKAPFIFVSGDRHMAEIMKIEKKDVGFKTFELTSSGLHAPTYPQALTRNPNSRRLRASAGPLNFMEIEPRMRTKDWLVRTKVWGVKEGLLFEESLKIKGR